jgi:hypothetical protein
MRKSGVPGALLLSMVAPRPLMVSGRKITGRPDGPDQAEKWLTEVRVYVPPGARLMVSGVVVEFAALMAAMSPATSPSGML